MVRPQEVVRLLLIAVLATGASQAATRSGAPARIDPPAQKGALAPNLFASSKGVLASWLEPAAKGATRLRFARLTPSGWTAPSTVVESKKLVVNWADIPSVVEGPSGILVAHWAERTIPGEGHFYDVVLALSADGGRKWARIGSPHLKGVPAEHGFVSLVPEAQSVRAVWLDGSSTASSPHGGTTLRTALVGMRIARDQQLDGRVCDCCSTSAARTSDASIIAYRDRTDGEVRDISVVRVGPAGPEAPVRVHADGWTIPGCPVNGPSIAAAGEQVAVAWYTYAESRPRVLVVFSKDGARTFGAPVPVDAGDDRTTPIGRVSVAWTSDGGGEVFVTWVAAVREQAELRVRRISADGRSGPHHVLATTRAERQSGFPKLARDGERFVVAWTEVSKASRIRAVSFADSFIPPASAAVQAIVAAAPQRRLGAKLPEVAARRIGDGRAANLASLRGSVIVLNVWATWCEPCRMELPVLSRVHDEFARRGVRVVGLSLDRDASDEKIEAFARQRKVKFELWRDPEEMAARALGVTTLPRTFVFDRSGKVVFDQEGALLDTDPALATAINKALGATENRQPAEAP